MAKTHRIAVVPGDGIGKETVPEALKVLDAASRSAWAKRIFDWPSVVRSSTSSVRLPSGTSPSMSALRPKPFACLRTYAIGADIRSAIQAANGMPAVSPPATASIVS